MYMRGVKRVMVEFIKCSNYIYQCYTCYTATYDYKLALQAASCRSKRIATLLLHFLARQ